MFNKLKNYIQSFSRACATKIQTVFQNNKDVFQNYNLLRQILGASKQQGATESVQKIPCLCGDFICDNTSNLFTLKELQDYLLPNSDIDFTKSVCTMTQASGLSSTSIGIGLGAIAALSFLYHWKKDKCDSNDQLTSEKKDAELGINMQKPETNPGF